MIRLTSKRRRISQNVTLNPFVYALMNDVGMISSFNYELDKSYFTFLKLYSVICFILPVFYKSVLFFLQKSTFLLSSKFTCLRNTEALLLSFYKLNISVHLQTHQHCHTNILIYIYVLFLSFQVWP